MAALSTKFALTIHREEINNPGYKIKNRSFYSLTKLLIFSQGAMEEIDSSVNGIAVHFFIYFDTAKMDGISLSIFEI